MRGQAFTLEGVVAGLLLVGALVFALQTASMGPSGALANAGVDDRARAGGGDSLLAVAAANGTIKPTLLYWNRTAGRFHNNTTGAGTPGNYSTGPPTAFGVQLNETLRDRGLAFNLNAYHLNNETGGRERVRVVYQGDPGANAVTATRSVTLYDDDRLYNATPTNATRERSGERLGNLSSDDFYANDTSSTGVYNVVVVEVVVWRS